MSQANVESKKPRGDAPSRPSWWRRCVYTLVVGLAGIGMMALVITIFGRCSGEEFSPQSFTRRAFFYFRVPLVKLQVTPVYREELDNDLVSYLQSTKYVGLNSRTWELVSLDTGIADAYEANPLILCRYLDQTNTAKTSTWLKWSREHTDLAAVFWPIIARVAREGLYVVTPGLFAAAREAETPADLRVRLHRRLTFDTLALARGQYQLADYEAAIKSCSLVWETVKQEAETGQNTAASDDGGRSDSQNWLAEIAVDALNLRSRAYKQCKAHQAAEIDRRQAMRIKSGNPITPEASASSPTTL